MAALKIFGKQKKEPAKKAAAKTADEPQAKTGPEKTQEAPKAGVAQHLVRPHITEKATDLASRNQYVFVVDSLATKEEIGRDVANRYGVVVEKTRIVNVRPKNMRLGRTKGVKKGYKKAIVQIKEGQKIEILAT